MCFSKKGALRDSMSQGFTSGLGFRVEATGREGPYDEIYGVVA